MGRIIIEIHSDIVDALRLPQEEKTSRLRQELAMRLYQKGLLSFGKARELAAMTKWEFHLLIGREGINRSYDLEELNEDLKTLETLS